MTEDRRSSPHLNRVAPARRSRCIPHQNQIAQRRIAVVVEQVDVARSAGTPVPLLLKVELVMTTFPTEMPLFAVSPNTPTPFWLKAWKSLLEISNSFRRVLAGT